MKLRKGDKVIVVSGKDKGKTGTIAEVHSGDGRVIVEGVNVMKRHTRSRDSKKPGQVVEKPFPIHHSNVMVVDPKTNKPTRIGITRKEDGKRVRVAKKSGQEL